MWSFLCFLAAAANLVPHCVDAFADPEQSPARWTRGNCDFGTVPGYWWKGRYKSFSKDCNLRRFVDEFARDSAAAEHGKHEDFTGKNHVLFIGDSLDRNLVIALADISGQEFRDYAPLKYLPDGRPQKIGRSGIVTFKNHTFSNLFIFAANNQKKYFSLWKEGQVAGMSDGTFDRVCQDGPRYLPYLPAEYPALVSVNSAYWEVGRWERYFGRFGKDVISMSTKGVPEKPMQEVFEEYNETVTLRRIDSPTYAHGSSIRLGKPLFSGMVLRHPLKAEEPNHVKELLGDFRREMEALMDKVEQCYPGTRQFCWRTAPRVATDDRVHHFFHKRPHIINALNQVARYTARKRGWCVLDLDLMLQGQGNNEDFVPDGAHPSTRVSLEYINVLLNVLNGEGEDPDSLTGSMERPGLNPDTLRRKQ